MTKKQTFEELDRPPSKAVQGAAENCFSDPVQPVKEGTVITVNQSGKTLAIPPTKHTAHPPCDNNQGFWYCVTHDKHFRNQFDKDTHIEKGKHTLAWLCTACNRYETP